MFTFILDIDGVITTSGRYKRYVKAGGPMEWGEIEHDHRLPLLFSPQAIQVLQELVDEYEPEVVLSTSWRNHVEFEHLCSHVLGTAAGLRLNIVGKTPSLPAVPGGWGPPSRPTRGMELRAYIEEHGLDPDSILIFEDEEDMRPYHKRQVKTSHYGSKSGLQHKHLKIARRILERGYA